MKYFSILIILFSFAVFAQDQSYDERYTLMKRDVSVDGKIFEAWIIDVDPLNYFYTQNPSHMDTNTKLMHESFQKSTAVRKKIRQSNEFVASDYKARQMGYEDSSDEDLIDQIFGGKSDPWHHKAFGSNVKAEDDYLNRRSRVILIYEKGITDNPVATIKWVQSNPIRYFLKLLEKSEHLHDYLVGITPEEPDKFTQIVVQIFADNDYQNTLEQAGHFFEIENLVIDKKFSGYDLFQVLISEMELNSNLASDAVVGIQSLAHTLYFYRLLGFEEMFAPDGVHYMYMNAGDFTQNMNNYVHGEGDLDLVPEDLQRQARVFLRQRAKKFTNTKIEYGTKAVVKFEPEAIEECESLFIPN